MFFIRKPVGVAAFHMAVMVEFIGNESQAAAFISEMEQTAGVADVDSFDVQFNHPERYREGPFLKKPYYKITIVVDDRDELMNVLDAVDNRCLATRQSSFS